MSDTTAPIPTARAERERGTTLGLDGEALDLFVRATARERHAWRTSQAREALLSACTVRGPDGEALPNWGDLPASAEPTYPYQVGARVAAMLDEIGVGGEMGAGLSGSTARLPWLAQLGKGRRQATDGAAWTAAIAAGALSIDSVHRLTVRPTMDDSEGDVCGLMAALIPSWSAEPHEPVWVSVTPRNGYDWVHALARRVLVDAARRQDSLSTALAAVDGPLADWGRLMADTAPKPIATAPVYTAIDDNDVEVIRRYPAEPEVEVIHRYVTIDAIGPYDEPLRFSARFSPKDSLAFLAALAGIDGSETLRAEIRGEEVHLFTRPGEDVVSVFTLPCGTWSDESGGVR